MPKHLTHMPDHKSHIFAVQNVILTGYPLPGFPKERDWAVGQVTPSTLAVPYLLPGHVLSANWDIKD